MALAEELRLTKVLRAAWYEASRSWTSGSSPNQPANYLGRHFSRCKLNVTMLRERELQRLIVGRERMKLAVLEFIDEIDEAIDEYSDRVLSHLPKCASRVVDWWEEEKAGRGRLDLVQDPLGELLRMQRALRIGENAWAAHSRSSGAMCHCVDQKEWLERQLWRKGKKIWDLLPEIFDMDLGSED